MKLYHGTRNSWKTYNGLCLTTDKDAAINYAEGGTVATVELNLAGLSVANVEPYDHDENWAYGDDGKNPVGCDVAVYDDEDVEGSAHTTYRLMTAKAVANVTVVKIRDAQ